MYPQKEEEESFEARLEQMSSRLKWVIIRVPFDPAKAWGKRGQIKVRGAINGFAFRTSLFPVRDGGHILLVNKRMQAAAGAGPGERARFVLGLDTEERTVDLPAELQRELRQDRELRAWFQSLNYSTRKYICDWITEVKQAASRERRAEQIAERLYQVMDAERELPPVLRQAFARNPRAEQGWQRMAPSHRRGHLFAIFYYRTVEGRNRRIEKMMDAAEQCLDKKESGQRTKRGDK